MWDNYTARVIISGLYDGRDASFFVRNGLFREMAFPEGDFAAFFPEEGFAF